VWCDPAHHHHVVCSGCGRTSEIDDAGLRVFVDEVAARTGFSIDTHRVELFGLCPACRADARD
jgi:Fur family ferric uptake transcriptional regulator